MGFPDGASGKEPACTCRRCKRCGFHPWVWKIPWRRTWKPLQYSCLENPMDRGAWRATVHNVTKSQICTHAIETTCWTQSGSSPPLEELGGGGIVRAFPWWLNGKRIHLPMQEKQVISLIWEDPTGCGAKKPVHHNYWACAPEPRKPNYWAHMPQLLKTSHPKECVPHKERYHNEKPVNHNKE